jgi:hypothetical protein
MNKLTRKPLNINTLIGKPGDQLKDISNISEWLYDARVNGYKTSELVDFLKGHGVKFTTETHLGSELGLYLPPKKSIGLSLKPHIKRLKTLYIENFKRNLPSNLRETATSDQDVKVLSQWVQNIQGLHKLKRTSLRNLALFHIDKKLILEARQNAYETIKKYKEAGTEWDNTSLFVTVKAEPQDEPQDEPAFIENEHSEIELLKQVIELQAQAIEDNQNQIKELKDYFIKAILNRGVK